MEILEILIILVILCAQAYVAYLAWGQIESIRHFLSSEDHLNLRQKSIELDDDEERAPAYHELEQVQNLGTAEYDSDEWGQFPFSPKFDIKVGDKIDVRKADERLTANITSIWNEDKKAYVESSKAHQTVDLCLDHPVSKYSILYKIGEQEKSKFPIVKVSEVVVDDKETSSLLRDVIKTINNYLKKNKGGAADFHLIKDIVERHTDSLDEEINHKLPVPIYLGLMGTVLGIIIGLFSLRFQFDPSTNSLNGELFVNSVSGLIQGVKLAMICSFVGLLLTTFLSSWRYMGAKSALETQKNAFYDFIQTRLLPQMTKDAASTILAMQANLERFNTSFESNIQNFGGIMEEIHTAFDSQVQLQRELRRMDLTQVANLNANVLVQLRESMGEFERFTQYLSQMNSFVRSTARLTDSINDQLQRTEAVETVVNALQENIQRNQLVMEKLREFLERVNEHQAIMTATGEIDSAMTQAVEQLRSHAEEQINSIRTYTTEATEDLRDLVTSERGHLRSLDKLEHLDQLDRLVSAINNMRDDNRAVNNALERRIESLAHAVIDNTRAQRGEGGMPAWLKFVCILLFVVMCAYVFGVGAKYMFDSREEGSAQTEMPNNGTAVNSAAQYPVVKDSVAY